MEDGAGEADDVMITGDGIAKDGTNIAFAARTRQRLTKYGILQLRMLDMYALKKVKINNAIMSTNKKIQIGHP